MHRKSQSQGSALSSANQLPKSGCSLVLAWLNANKSAMGALAILGLVIYAVFFPHPERGPREIAAEIMPTASRVNEFKGEPRDIDNWKELHKQYVEEIKLKVARKETLDIIFYGDSITEAWRGLQVGVPVEKFKGIPEIFAKAYGGVRAAAYSISGDRTEHLYWRLQNGEGPKDLKPRAVVLLIGTNDLNHVYDLLQLEAVSTKIGAGCVAAVEEILQQAPSAHVALVGLLPRGDRNVEAPSVAYHQPSKYTPAIEATNEKLKAYARLHTRVDFLDCSAPFLEDDDKVEGGKRLKKAMMPDSLHPSPEGMDSFAACLRPLLNQYGVRTAEDR